MEATAAPARRSWGKLVVLGALGLVCLSLLASSFVVPLVLQRELPAFVQGQTGTLPTIEGVKFNPLTQTLTIEGFSLGETDPVIAFDSLEVDFRLIGFLKADVALGEVVFRSPRVRAVLGPDGTFNLSNLLTGEGDPEEPDDAASEPLVIDIRAIRIEAGTLSFQDQGVAEGFEVELTPLDFDVENFSTGAGTSASYQLAFSVDDASHVEWQGEVGLTPLVSSGSVQLNAFSLPLVGRYFTAQLPVGLEKGTLTLSAPYELRVGEKFDFWVAGATVALMDLVVTRSPRSAAGSEATGDARGLLSVPSLSVDGLDVEVRASALGSLTLDEISSQGGTVALRLGPKGQVEWSELFSSSDSEDSEDARESKPVEPADENSTALKIEVAKLDFRDWAIDFQDQSVKPAVELPLRELSLNVTNWALHPKPGQEGFSAAVSARVGESGQISARGPLVMSPFSGELAVEATALSIKDFDPYLRRFAAVAVTRGEVGGAWQVELATEEGGALAVSVHGDGGIEDLNLHDLGRDETAIEWKSIGIEGLAIDPESIVVDRIAIEALNARLAIGTDGKSNWDRILAGGSAQEAGPKSKSAAPDSNSSPKILIRKVAVRESGARFSDQTIQPPFKARLLELSGALDGLSSEPGPPAALQLTGKIDGVSPVRVVGKVNPLRDDADTDITLVVEGVEMPLLSPYAGRFVGYGVKRGKLDIELDYQLRARHLEAQNRFKLRQLEFGDKVDGADRLTLPVPLAMALMRNAKGEVSFDLPVKGNLDDPSFDLFTILGRGFVSLVTKVASAPFNVLGSLVNLSLDEMSHVVFAAGSNELSDQEAGEIAQLVEALADKSKLRLEIRGRADPAVDGPARDSTGWTDEEWRDFARGRALAIQEAILLEGRISAERVFVMEVGVGDHGSDGTVASELTLTTN